MRRFITLAAVYGVALAALAYVSAGQEPGEPERLVPKKKAPAEEKKAEPGKEQLEPLEPLEPLPPIKEGKGAKGGPPAKGGGAPAEDKSQEIMARIAKNLESVGDRLKKEDAGTTTRDLQDKILKDLDELLKKQQDEENKQQNQQNQNQQSQSKDQKSDQSKSGQKSQSKGSKGSKGSQGSQSAKTSKGQQGEPKQGTQTAKNQGGNDKKEGSGGKEKQQGKDGKDQGKEGKQQGKDGKDPKQKGGQGTDGGGGKDDDRKTGRVADLDINRDVWGHLPDAKRQEMDAYSRERFLQRYDELLRQYYRSIAAQNRRKGSE
jgi:hypothetical protein